MASPGKSLLLITEDDREYAHEIKGLFGGEIPYVISKPIDLLMDLVSVCRQGGITKIVSTNTSILRKLLAKEGSGASGLSISEGRKEPKLSNYAGSFFEHEGLEIVFIWPLKQLFTVPHGKFITSRFISKLVAPETWEEPTQFKWEVLTAYNWNKFYDRFQYAAFITVDIETFKTNLAIRCIGYTAFYIRQDGSIESESVVLPIDNDWALATMRDFNNLPAIKVTQNGKYDNAYLLRYGAPLYNWIGDTAHLMHGMYSELPKDLAFLNAFFLRKVVYWKDLAETSDLYEYYRYNAIDTWATGNVFIQQLIQAQPYALKNYLLEFPLVFPCLLSELTGLLRDQDRLNESVKIVSEKIDTLNAGLNKILGTKDFNVNSPVQVKKLLEVMGCKDWESTDEKHINKAMYLHPLNAKVLGYVPAIRGERKLLSTYLSTGEDSKDYKGAFLYSLNPHHTDTGRLASGESAFWCGSNIQNIPGGWEVKATLRAPAGFYIAESDLEQAESRDTGYISGDTAIIDAVSGDRDFHSVNASTMSGVPYTDIYDDERKKPKNKPLRTTFKRVNHGANYNMTYGVLLDTMGHKEVYEAKILLGLPFYSAEEICEFLLCRFHQVFNKLKGPTKIRFHKVQEYLGLPDCEYKLYSPGTYYASIATEVRETKRITSRAFHHTSFNLTKYPGPEGALKYIEEGDWTRVCFGKPWEQKLSLNAYVAHPSQSLNARTLNEAYMRVFYSIALPYAEHFRLYAQIHDSILHAYREGWEHLSELVKEKMEIPVTVRDVFGVVRTFTVPAALKIGIVGKDGVLKRAVYWNETE